MICTLFIKLVGGTYYSTEFERTIEARDDMTLGELHHTMQDLTGFDSDHLFMFFMARTMRSHRTYVADDDEWEVRHEKMYRIPLKKIFPVPKGQKLFYWFDFGDDWIFEVRKRGKEKPEQKDIDYPRLISKLGPEPVQYPNLE